MDETRPPQENAAFTYWTPRHFRSAKTPTPILAASRLHEDYLGIRSLDEEVSAIMEAPKGIVETPDGFDPDYEVISVDGRRTFVHLLTDDIGDAERSALLESANKALDKGVAYQVVGEPWVSQEPRRRNVRMVFSSRRTRVSPGDRVRILHHLDEQGKVQILDLAKCVAASTDAVECVLALVAEGSVMVEIDRTLAPETLCWRIGEPGNDED